MQENGIGLRSIVDGIDPSTASGRLQLGLFATLAEYERELINEKVRAGVQAAKARGVRFGQKPVDETQAEDDRNRPPAPHRGQDGGTRCKDRRVEQGNPVPLPENVRIRDPAPGQAELEVGTGRSQYAERKLVPLGETDGAGHRLDPALNTIRETGTQRGGAGAISHRYWFADRCQQY